jgi:hypothetical protein
MRSTFDSTKRRNFVPFAQLARQGFSPIFLIAHWLQPWGLFFGFCGKYLYLFIFAAETDEFICIVFLRKVLFRYSLAALPSDKTGIEIDLLV